MEQALQKESLKRYLQNHLTKFTKYFFRVRGDKFIENGHHDEIADVLGKLERGELCNEAGEKCTVVVINMPPRYGKTEEIVINWPAKCIAINPKSKFIHLSYSDDLALDNSSRTKELILCDEYQKLWPVKLKDDAKSKKKWYTEQGGGFYATAAGGAITGFGAGSLADVETDEEEDEFDGFFAGSEEEDEDGLFYGAIIIDDPLKVDDADRDGERARVNKRLNTTIKSRRNSRNTPIVIVMQRLHEEDMSGFVLDGGIGEPVYHLKLPAIIDGKPLWPFKHSMEDLEKERSVDPRTFAGQMMQEPAPEDGTFFKREWFRRFNLGDEPETYKFGAGDCAVTEPEIGQEPDFTEQGIGGFDRDENLWMLDWYYGKVTMDKWIDEQIRLVKKYSPFVWVAEKGIIRRASEPFLKKEQKIQNCYFRMEWIAAINDKAVNARAFQALASQGKVRIPNTPWGERLITQLLKFPGGKHDDGVDVCGLFGRLLDKTYGPRELIEEDKRSRDSYGSEEDDDESWR